MPTMNHIIVESESAVMRAKQHISQLESVTWHTTSPWLLEKLNQQGEAVHSLEEAISIEQQNILMQASLNTARQIASTLDQSLAPIFNGLRVGSALERNIQQTIHVLVYKSMLLGLWQQRYSCGANRLLVVGEKKFPDINREFCLSTADSRHQFFAAFAALKPNLTIINHSSPALNPAKPLTWDRSVFKYERFFRLSHLSFSGWITAINHWLKRHGILKKDDISLVKNNKNTIIFLKRCASIDELLLPLLIRGHRVLNYFHNIHFKLTPKAFGWHGSYTIIKNALKANIAGELAIDIELISKQLALAIDSALTYGKDLASQLPVFYRTIESYPGDMKLILTNHLTSPSQQLIQQYLYQNNINCINFQHGVTAGIDGVNARIERDHYSSAGHDYWCCYSAAALQANASHGQCLGGEIVGAPKQVQVGQIEKLLKPWIKHSLKIPLSDRVVTYITCLPRNNRMVAFSQNDWNYYRVTRSIATRVLAKLDCTCLIKEYPLGNNIRYQDPGSFLELLNLPKHIRLLRNTPYTHIRSISNIVIFNYIGSVIDDVWSSNIPFIFVEFPDLPLVDDFREQFKAACFWIDGTQITWQEELLNILQLPSQELERIWQTKRKARLKLQHSHIFGPIAKNTSKSLSLISTVLEKQSQAIFSESLT